MPRSTCTPVVRESQDWYRPSEMKLLFAAALAALLAQPTTPGVHELSTEIPGVGTVLYAISVPRGYSADRPAPLVLALHSGGERPRHYGSAFTKLLVLPAVDSLKPIILAPDCPTDSWSDPEADKAVMTLIESVMRDYAIDRKRVLVTGFSMGGRGTWYMATAHPDLFTAAIPMAASTRGIASDNLGTMPTYVIHSRADEVVPFEPAEQNARALARLGRPVRFEALNEFHHFEMFRYVDSLRRGSRWIAEQWNKQP
jgi:predicted peptidase